MNTLLSAAFIVINIAFLKAKNDVDMINDVAESYDQPTSIVAKVCWSTSIKKQWAEKLSNMRRPRTISFVEANIAHHFIPAVEVLIILDTSCKEATKFILEADANQRFRKPYRWLLLGSLFTNGSIAPALKNISVLIDSEFITAEKTENNEYLLKLIYRKTSNSEWCFENFGTWSKNYGLQKSKDLELSSSLRRRNLKGLKIVTSAIISNNRSKDELEDLSNILVDTVTKGTLRHIFPLYYFMNATRAYLFCDDWGYYRNGSWSGMIGDLVRGDAEIGGTLAFITKQRLAVVDFLSHPTPITAKFVFREPPLSYQHNLFLLPFKTTVWCCIGAFIVLVVLILYVNAQWEVKKTNYSEKSLSLTALRPNLSDIVIFLVSAISQQGSYHELKGTLGRMVMFILFMTFLFLYTSYSANIVALLQSSSSQIRSLSDLLHSKLELGVEDVAYNRHYFSTATEPVRKAIYETKVAPKGSKPNFLSIEDGVKKLQKEPFAFNMNIGMGYSIVEKYFHEHEKCGLQEIEYIQDNKPWISCKKNSPFREIYKIGLFRIYEHGLSDRENHQVYTKKPVCTARGANFGSVNMIDFYPVLLMLIYGMMTSFLLLIIEILIHYKKTAQRKLNGGIEEIS